MKLLIVFKNNKEYKRYIFDYIECSNGYFNIYQYCKKTHKIKFPNDFIICTNYVSVVNE